MSTLPPHSSVRNFDGQQMSKEQVQKLIALAQTASTSNFRQAYSIMWLSDEKLREKVGELSGNKLQFTTCNAAFVLVVDFRRLALACELNEQKAFVDSAENMILGCTDAAIFAEKLEVVAELEGYNVCYIGGVRNNIAAIDELLQLPEYTFPLFGLCIGKAKTPEDIPAVKPRLAVDAILMENAYVTKEEQLKQIQDFDVVTNDYYLHRATNKKDTSWSKDMANTCVKFNRPHIKAFLESKGFTFQ